MIKSGMGQMGTATALLEGEVLVVAGEASGDHHAAGLIRALQSEAPGLRFYGMGGREMVSAGFEALHDARDLAVMGLAEVAGSLRRGLKTLRSLRATLRERRPRAAVLVDFPEFNLKLARAAREAGIPVIVFVSPQLWAWRARRVQTVARCVDRVICILPFETAFYRQHGVRAVFVGHPLVDSVRAPEREPIRSRWNLPAGQPVLALLPGSRRQEIRSMLPQMLEAARRLEISPGLSGVLLPVASTLSDTEIRAAAGSGGFPDHVQLVQDGFLDALTAADLAIVASGTSTLAAALTDTPMILGYRVHPLTYVLGRHLTRVPHVGLVNLVAGRRAVPELIQDDFTGENLAREARHLLGDPAAMEAQRSAFREVSQRLGPPGVFARAAEAVIATIVGGAGRGKPPVPAGEPPV